MSPQVKQANGVVFKFQSVSSQYFNQDVTTNSVRATKC